MQNLSIYTICTILLLNYCHCRSTGSSQRYHGNHREERSTPIGDNLLLYLMNFGYLPQSDFETGNLRSEDEVKDAIRSMQSFAGIPVTGQLDNATRQLMRTPRCAMPDIISDDYRSKRSADFSVHNGTRIRHEKSRSKRYTVQGQKWQKKDLTYSVRPPYTGQMDLGTVRSQVRRALQLWSDVSQLNFLEKDSDAADIKISFHTGYHNDGYPFDGKGNVLAHAFFPGSGTGGDAHFDNEEHWQATIEDGSRGTSFYAVAVHEFGHSLGLSHSSVQGAIMYPYYQNIKDDYKLADDDIRGIQSIYGARDKLLPAPLPTNPAPPRPTPTKKPLVPTKWTTPPSKRPTTQKPAIVKPNPCDTSYDAITVFRRELFIFKDRYFWRLGSGGSGRKDLNPIEISTFWYGLPKNLTHIDAVYERPTSKRELVIFIGKQYWIYYDNQNRTGPYPLTNLGLPADLEKIDAAMVWGHNGRIYFFSGTMYWRFDDKTQKVELDYPRDMSMWKGVPYNVDSAFQWSDGKTYFFKGKVFWKFNDRRMRVESRTPSLSAPFWMGCPSNQLESTDDLSSDEWFDERFAAASTPSSGNLHLPSITVLIFLRLILLYI